MIVESGIVAATTSDLLSGGRLNAMPYQGQLSLEVLSQLADATNSYAITIQKPDGSVPVDAQMVPGCNPALAGVLDERQLLRFVFTATIGGHFMITLTETGTAVCTWRATLSP